MPDKRYIKGREIERIFSISLPYGYLAKTFLAASPLKDDLREIAGGKRLRSNQPVRRTSVTPHHVHALLSVLTPLRLDGQQVHRVAAQLLELIARVLLHERRVAANMRVIPLLRFERLQQVIGGIITCVRFLGKLLIRIHLVPGVSKLVVDFEAAIQEALLPGLEGERVLNNLLSGTLTVTSEGPAVVIPVHGRVRGIRVRFIQRLVVDNAVILLRERVLVVVTPHALFIVGVDPELQHTGRRVNVFFGQVGAVNLRNHAQRLTLLIGRSRLACGQVRSATKLGCGLRQRRVRAADLQANRLLTRATLVERVDDAACLRQGLFGGLVLRHCVLVSSVN
ncbi:signal transduction histidine kinase [Rothia mucilaginosa DY-18]|uniref:Signal transduction histidine kinase n=1 Tax=Rothia mucilaginosa (strain DY-18) TaxID=680646 RepID=D2NPY1_ROTMD|nr:signal transduction histidine kinase [Rothia mucilaginosa DY-18]